MYEKMIFNQPAADWHEAFPLGNGRIGALVHGGTALELIPLNEDTLWTGYPDRNNNSVGDDYIKDAFSLLAQKKYAQVMDVIKDCCKNTEDHQRYQMFGNLWIEIAGEEEVTDYYRELDLKTAKSLVRYRDHGKLVIKESFISEPDQVMVYRIRTEVPVTVGFCTEGGNLVAWELRDNMMISYGQCPGKVKRKGEPWAPGGVYPDGTEQERKGAAYIGCGRAVSSAGKYKIKGDKLLAPDIISLRLCHDQ